jgi:hypothetical protein
VAADPNPAGELLCPSAQPEQDGALLHGIVGGTPAEPLVSYLDAPQPVTPELLELAKPVRPTEVFRFAAPCAEGGCQHYDGSRCKLAQKLVRTLPAAVERLPRCRLRPRCRWFAEEGGAACMRCPVVVTLDQRAGADLREAADPATPVGA